MQFALFGAINGSEELHNSYKYPNIRVFQAQMIARPSPINDLAAVAEGWSVPQYYSLIWFSAVCWYYGKNLHLELNVPIGLVESTWGGTNDEKWSSPDSLAVCNTPKDPTDSTIYNAMIHPFLNMTIYGTIWYQGESNTG